MLVTSKAPRATGAWIEVDDECLPASAGAPEDHGPRTVSHHHRGDHRIVSQRFAGLMVVLQRDRCAQTTLRTARVASPVTAHGVAVDRT